MLQFLAAVFRYFFITIIYIFIFAIIRMISLDIKNMLKNETFTETQNTPILKVVSYQDKTYHGPRNHYPLNKARIIIGHSASCDIKFDDISMSNRHAEIWFEDGEWHINDLDSQTGTFLNNTRIDEVYLLDDGDLIRVGEMELELRL